MKILVAHVQSFFGPGGGADTFAREISKTFKKMGHEVHFLQRGNKDEDFIYKGIKIHSYKTVIIPYIGALLWPILIQSRIKDKLIEINNQQKFDFVLSINAMDNNQIVKILKTPILYRCASIEASEFKKTWKELTFRNKFSAKTFMYFEKKAINNPRNKIILISHAQEKLLKTIYPKHSLYKIINNGVDFKKYQPKKKKSKNAKIQIICSSRISPEKNLNALIKAVGLSKTTFELSIFGKGHTIYEAQLKKEIFKKNLNFIKLKGYSSNMPKNYRNSDLMIFPSKHEAFGNAILEAMSSGLPVIAFKPDGKKIITASDEIIKDGVTGFLVKDEKEMAQKIDLLASNEALRQKMGKAARKEAEKYSWKKCAKKILNFAK